MHNALHLPILLSLALVLGACSVQAAQVAPSPDQATPAQPQQWTFDSDPVGGLPRDATVFSGNWIVRREPGAPSEPNALCQTAVAEYPALSLGNAVYTDVALSARFKTISGVTDQAAGLIFRVQDRDNYYIVRANALEDNVNVYKYVNGQRTLIKEGSALVPSGQWGELRVEVVGNQIKGYLGPRLIVQATDDTFEAGKVGLWTKSDSVTCFDDVTVQAPGP